MKVRSNRQDALSLIAVAGTVAAFEKYLKDPSSWNHTCFQTTLSALADRFTANPSTTQAVLVEYLTEFRTSI
jgi:hypothetical protein